MRSGSRFVWLSPLVFLLAGAVPGHAAESECAPRGTDDEMPDVLFVVDGEVVEESALSDPPDQISRVEIICWETAERWLGIRVRNAVVVVHTKRGPAMETKASLIELIEAQEGYLERHETYTDDLLSLTTYAPPSETYVYLTLSEDGWTARTEHLALRQVCHVFVGMRSEIWTRLNPGPEPWPAEGEPICL